jgi:superfamily II DNA helicase RecQ
LTDRTLTALAGARPRNEDELLAVSGLGPRLVARYGPTLLQFMKKEALQGTPA